MRTKKRWRQLLCAGLVLLGVACTAAESAERATMDLSGAWEFKLDPSDVGRAGKWFDPSVTYERSIQVPGAWNAQGVGFAAVQELRDYEEQRLEEQKALNKLGTLGVQRESERLFSVFPGPGWYRKQVTIPAEWNGKIPWLVFEGVHREAELWVNGQPAGVHHSYLTPFRVDLSRYARPGEDVRLVLRVDARRRKEVDPLMGCLDTLDFLYVTWGGIHGRARMEVTDATRIENVFVVPRLAAGAAEIRFAIEGERNGPLSVVAEVLDAGGVTVASVRQEIGVGARESMVTALLPGAMLWTPKSPHLYSARLRLFSGDTLLDARTTRFGMREFKVADGKFLLNGKPIFLRGYGEDCIFPNTIAPPADKEEFRRRLALARDYGFNYVRHHSWTPPEEYLEAADELGMMLQPEFPFAYRWDLPTTPEAKRAALEQWSSIIRLRRNHPSIVTWCMGNELYDSFDLAPEMYQIAKQLDPTRVVIDSDGCNFNHKGRATLDFMVVQFGEGNSIGFGDGKYNIPKEVTKPVVAHEMGYFVTLPDLGQFDLFRGGLRPYWLQQTRELAVKNGMQEDYPAWLKSSYRLQAASLKCNQEAARRSRLSGTSVWLFQDYPNCAEGVVDMFLRPKGVPASEFRKFNSPTVLLLDVPRRSWRPGETVGFNFAVSRYEDPPSDGATLRWELKSGAEILSSGLQEKLHISDEGLQTLPAIQLVMPRSGAATRLTLSAELVDATGRTQNEWSLWVFPSEMLPEGSHKLRSSGVAAVQKLYPWLGAGAASLAPADAELLIAGHLDEAASEYLKAGGRVLLLDPEPDFAIEKTNFRLSSWDGGGPSGTILEANHPALRGMNSDGWCDLQFYPLIQGSKTVFLNAFPGKIRPLVRCIDRPTRLADRAYLFEVSVGKGSLLVSGFNFERAIQSGDPAGAFLLDQLVRYAVGPEFRPVASIPVEALKERVKK